MLLIIVNYCPWIATFFLQAQVNGGSASHRRGAASPSSTADTLRLPRLPLPSSPLLLLLNSLPDSGFRAFEQRSLCWLFLDLEQSVIPKRGHRVLVTEPVPD